MPATPPLFAGITSGTPPVLQPGSQFTNRTYGMDDGRRTFLVHPAASNSLWPQKGTTDATHPGMYVLDVADRLDESTLIALDVTYKGINSSTADRITPDVDLQMLTIPATSVGPSGTPTYSGPSANVLFPMPQPKLSREYVTTSKPDYSLVGVAVTSPAGFFPDVPVLELYFTVDPSKPPTVNFWKNQWVLQSRTWQEIIPGKVWFVRERFVYYYAIVSA